MNSRSENEIPIRHLVRSVSALRDGSDAAAETLRIGLQTTGTFAWQLT